MDENDIGRHVLGCALTVHKALGPGLLENAYETCLSHELATAGLEHKRQHAFPVIYDGVKVDLGYRLDLLVADRVVVEVKAVETLTGVHRAQVLSYLRLGGYRLGYLLNFNVKLLKDGICRFAKKM
ncbi:MAG TPA: GxxExxY protein [Caulobacteraceae bacterium]|nr:GxxExxY protein [Caulobacteraceae bacterium]